MNRQAWLILTHQLPSHPSNIRVKVWRKLQTLRAIPIRNSICVYSVNENQTIGLRSFLLYILLVFSINACKNLNEPQEIVSETSVWNFDSDSVGKSPKGFKVLSGKWIVQSEPTTASSPNVCAQISTSEMWPTMILENGNYKDCTLSVRFRTISGAEDRAAGIVFRYKDQGHFYVFRANEVEDNLILFKFVGGKREKIIETNMHITHDDWHRIKVQCIGDKITCYFDGETEIDVKDDFYREGKIGLWTKADSVTYFDDFAVVPIRDH